MSKALITIGAMTSHGGQVIQGNVSSTINGIAIAGVGDKVTCPIPGHGGVTTIITGDSGLIIQGRAVARHGDKTACGATLIANQTLTIDSM